MEKIYEKLRVSGKRLRINVPFQLLLCDAQNQRARPTSGKGYFPFGDPFYLERELNEKFLKNIRGESEGTFKYLVRQ